MAKKKKITIKGKRKKHLSDLLKGMNSKKKVKKVIPAAAAAITTLWTETAEGY